MLIEAGNPTENVGIVIAQAKVPGSIEGRKKVKSRAIALIRVYLLPDCGQLPQGSLVVPHPHPRCDGLCP